MNWRVATLALSALGGGKGRREAAGRLLHLRRLQVEEELAVHLAAHTLLGIERDFGDACRADLGDAARTLASLAALTTPLRTLDAASRARLQADLDALDRALAQKIEDVQRGLDAVGPAARELPELPEAA